MFLRVIHNRSLERRVRFIEGAIDLDAISLQTAQVFGFIVRLPRLPAAPQNSYPLEGQLADSHPFAFTFFQLVLIERRAQSHWPMEHLANSTMLWCRKIGRAYLKCTTCWVPLCFRTGATPLKHKRSRDPWKLA